MDTNKILGERFHKFFKYLRIIAIVSALAFLILNAINTGNVILYWINYALLMIALVAALQSVVLYLLSKAYLSKVKK